MIINWYLPTPQQVTFNYQISNLIIQERQQLFRSQIALCPRSMLQKASTIIAITITIIIYKNQRARFRIKVMECHRGKK